MNEDVTMTIDGRSIKFLLYWSHFKKWDWCCLGQHSISTKEWNNLAPKLDGYMSVINSLPIDPQLGPSFAGMSFEEFMLHLIEDEHE
jgi:hypothetical protein